MSPPMSRLSFPPWRTLDIPCTVIPAGSMAALPTMSQIAIMVPSSKLSSAANKRMPSSRLLYMILPGRRSSRSRRVPLLPRLFLHPRRSPALSGSAAPANFRDLVWRTAAVAVLSIHAAMIAARAAVAAPLITPATRRAAGLMLQSPPENRTRKKSKWKTVLIVVGIFWVIGLVPRIVNSIIGALDFKNSPTEMQVSAQAASDRLDSAPAQESAPAPVEETFTPPDPIIYTGYGDDYFDISPFDSLYYFRITGNSGAHHFAVTGYDASGNYTDLFVNTTESYTGYVLDPEQNTRMLEVDAEGPWTVEIRSLYTAPSFLPAMRIAVLATPFCSFRLAAGPLLSTETRSPATSPSLPTAVGTISLSTPPIHTAAPSASTRTPPL